MFDGCKLDRSTNLWIEHMGGCSTDDWWVNEGQDEENSLLHCAGKCTKSFKTLFCLFVRLGAKFGTKDASI